MATKRSDVVSASEIASWEWCPESWRLDSLGKEPENHEERAHGSRFHSRTTFAEVLTRKLIALGWWLVALGLLGAAVAAVYFKVVG